MQLIIACFTEAPHNPVAAFLAVGIIAQVGLAIYVGVRSIVRSFTREG